LVDILVLICDLGQHPLPQQPTELLKLQPFKQVEKGGIAGCLGRLEIQCCAEGLVMRLAKRSRSLALRQPLRMPRIAINSNKHWG